MSKRLSIDLLSSLDEASAVEFINKVPEEDFSRSTCMLGIRAFGDPLRESVVWALWEKWLTSDNKIEDLFPVAPILGQCSVSFWEQTLHLMDTRPILHHILTRESLALFIPPQRTDLQQVWIQYTPPEGAFHPQLCWNSFRWLTDPSFDASSLEAMKVKDHFKHHLQPDHVEEMVRNIAILRYTKKEHQVAQKEMQLLMELLSDRSLAWWEEMDRVSKKTNDVFTNINKITCPEWFTFIDRALLSNQLAPSTTSSLPRKI